MNKMPLSLEILKSSMSLQNTEKILNCNDYTINFNLILTTEQALEIDKSCKETITELDRIDLNGGIAEKIIRSFCDSPYIYQSNYVETINQLVVLFYYYKNETNDHICDDDLIDFMVQAFNGYCGGSLELLADNCLEALMRNINSNNKFDYNEYFEDRSTEHELEE